jgi:CHAT domain
MTDKTFAIDLTALQDDLYRVTVTTLDGEWTADAISPFAKGELRDTLASFSSAQAATDDYTEHITAFGQQLFDFLIGQHPDLLAAYRKALDQAGSHRLFVRLSCSKAGRFSAIPWEVLRDSENGYLALSRQTPLVRWLPELDPRPPAPLIYPLKMLVMIPSPPNYPPIDVETEWEQLNRVTADLQAAGLLLLERVEPATLPVLRRYLRSVDYQALYYLGHTSFDEPTRQGSFALEDEHSASGSRPISAAEMGNEIGAQSTIRLFIVESVSREAIAPLTTSQQLLQAGLAAVLTTSYPLSQQTSKLFRSVFYPPLCEGHPVEAALNVARRAIADQTAKAEWGKLALFLRVRDGRLFHLSS